MSSRSSSRSSVAIVVVLAGGITLSLTGIVAAVCWARRALARFEDQLTQVTQLQEELLLRSCNNNNNNFNPPSMLTTPLAVTPTFGVGQGSFGALGNSIANNNNNNSNSITLPAATLMALDSEWTKLREAVLTLHSTVTATTTTTMSVATNDSSSSSSVFVGCLVRVKRLADVKTSRLWDGTNNKYCSREGVVTRIDADGDVFVTFEDDDSFCCDASFLFRCGATNNDNNNIVPMSVPPTLMTSLWAVDRIVKKAKVLGFVSTDGTISNNNNNNNSFMYSSSEVSRTSTPQHRSFSNS
eukprot:PhM_4_TR419/c1_g1_i1/m.23558